MKSKPSTAMPLRLACAVLTGVCTFSARAADGFANVNGTVTGGAAGPTVFVGSEAELQQYSDVDAPYTIHLTKSFNLTAMNTHIRSNKTVVGDGNIVLSGGGLYLYRSSNVIIQNLTIANSSEDDIGIHYSDHVWIDHCTIKNATDGGIDITQSSDYITISWCKFIYDVNNGHDFVNLIASSDSDNGSQYHVTFHHNWWSTLCIERMPSVRFGRVHVYNNYYNSPGNAYCVRTRIDAQLLVENNFFENVHNPWERYVTSGTAGLLLARGNNVGYLGTANGVTWSASGSSVLIPGTDAVFTPPYSYTMDSAANVKTIVTAGAGAGGGGGGTTQPPAAPSNLTATAASSAQINLAWTDNASNETGFAIDRATNSTFGSGLVTSTVGAGVTSFQATGLAASTTYYFRVRATNSAGGSANSNTASATTQASGSTATTIQAEAGAVGGGTVIETTNGGFNGTGYANFTTTGGSLQFSNVNGGSASGSHTIAIRFANGTTSSRTGRVLINGVAQNISFAPTGGWTTWNTQNVTVTLNAGTTNTIRFESTGQDLGNIDQIIVQ